MERFSFDSIQSLRYFLSKFLASSQFSSENLRSGDTHVGYFFLGVCPHKSVQSFSCIFLYTMRICLNYNPCKVVFILVHCFEILKQRFFRGVRCFRPFFQQFFHTSSQRTLFLSLTGYTHCFMRHLRRNCKILDFFLSYCLRITLKRKTYRPKIIENYSQSLCFVLCAQIRRNFTSF